MSAKDFKATLLMPNTTFEMKANLVQKEVLFREFWANKAIYQQVLAKNFQQPKFILHDGPPYANGSIHVGHALNKILKDIIVRYKNMTNFYAPYFPGWDTHGLPIENKILERTSNKLKDNELRKEAHNYAMSQVDSQAIEFGYLSLFSDLKTRYITLDPKYEAIQLKLFKTMVMSNYIYKGLRPIYWSPTLKSALAEAEIEYQTITSPEIFVAFNITNYALLNLAESTTLVIMTTTPWTLVANAGVAVNEKFEYQLLKVENHAKHYIVAKARCHAFLEKINGQAFEILQTFSGEELTKLTYAHPLFSSKTCPVIVGHHVSDQDGSGLVHIAPLFGEDDFIIGQKFKLEMIMHVNDDGTFNHLAPHDLQDKYYLDANKLIGEKLQTQQTLLSLNFIKHQYPHDWRSNKPVIFRGTPQWFVNINDLRPKLLKALQNVDFYPDWGKARLTKMIQERADWTISRQRKWGLPIIIFYDEDGKIIKDEVLFDHVIDIVAKHGSAAWFEFPIAKLLPSNYQHRKLTREEDIMDVWFDSGTSALFINHEHQLALPFDLYLEGSDQYRGWFNSSLVNTVAFLNQPPYKKVISHGFVLDEKNAKMSKSKGNVVDPLQIVKQNGTDILRLWVANSEYTSDVTISSSIINQTSDLYRNIRIKLRFLLGNLYQYEHEIVKKQDVLGDFHDLMAEALANLKFEVKQNYEQYRFSQVIKQINHFILEISSFYLDYGKDLLYADASNNPERQKMLSNIYDMAFFIIVSLAPILPTTMEEAYGHFPKKSKQISVFLEEIDFSQASDQKTWKSAWSKFWLLRDYIFKDIEIAKQNAKVNRSEEVWFNITNEKLSEVLGRDYQTLHFLKFNLAKILKLAKLTFTDHLANGIIIWESTKCVRCWNHFESAQVTSETICLRCDEVINSRA